MKLSKEQISIVELNLIMSYYFEDTSGKESIIQ